MDYRQKQIYSAESKLPKPRLLPPVPAQKWPAKKGHPLIQPDVRDSNDSAWDGGFTNDDDMMNVFDNQAPPSSTTVQFTIFELLNNSMLFSIGKDKVYLQFVTFQVKT